MFLWLPVQLGHDVNVQIRGPWHEHGWKPLRQNTRTPHMPYCVKTQRCPQNQRCITDCIVVRGWPSHCHRLGVQKISWSFDVWFLRYASGQTDRHTRSSQSFASVPWRSKYVLERMYRNRVRIADSPSSADSLLSLLDADVVGRHARLCPSVLTCLSRLMTLMTHRYDLDPWLCYNLSSVTWHR